MHFVPSQSLYCSLLKFVASMIEGCPGRPSSHLLAFLVSDKFSKMPSAYLRENRASFFGVLIALLMYQNLME